MTTTHDTHCTGCAPTTRHMHHIVSQDNKDSKGRATYCTGCAPTMRRVQHICQADKCRQGRTACPVPQACEVADATDAGRPGSELGCATSTARFILLVLAAIAAAALLAELALSA